MTKDAESTVQHTVVGNTVYTLPPEKLVEFLQSKRTTPSDDPAEVIRRWNLRDTWTVQQGLLLLIGLDPDRSSIGPSTRWVDGAGNSLMEFLSVTYLDGRHIPYETWQALFEQSVVSDDLRLAVNQEVWGLGEQYRELLAVWRSGAHPDRSAPGVYEAWATEKGFPVAWIDLKSTRSSLHLGGKEPLEDPKKSPAGPSPWIAKAVEIANEVAEKRQLQGRGDITAREVSNEVAEILGEDKDNWGKRGRRTAEGVRRQALKGWTAPSPSSGAVGANGGNE